MLDKKSNFVEKIAQKYNFFFKYATFCAKKYNFLSFANSICQILGAS